MAALLGWTVAAIALGVVAAQHRVMARRSELAARACHELRGPLTAASLALHAAGRDGQLTHPRVAAFELELRRAAVAADDVSAALAGRRARQRAERVEVDRLLASQLEVWRAVARARGCELRLAAPLRRVVVRGDEVRIAQATANLIGNAIEHGGGSIELAPRIEDGRLRIELADGGPGLPCSVGELVRRPRAGRGARGRGLAIAAGIAAEHGGWLTAAGGGTGARLAIELPVIAASEAPAGQGAAA